LLRAAFIGQMALTLFVCVNCHKLGVILFLSTVRVSSWRPCVWTVHAFCQAFTHTHTHARGGWLPWSILVTSNTHAKISI
jgi:hypothetical protein